MRTNVRTFLTFLLVLGLSFTLTACVFGDKDPTSSQSSSSSSEESSSDIGTDDEYDFGGMEIVFMVSYLPDNDPFNPNYTGSNKIEKQNLQQAVEEKYNIKIVYKPFPEDAGWGPPRIWSIIESVEDSEPMAHFYQVLSSWVPVLAANNAIVPVENLISEIDHGYYDENLNQFATYKEHVYAFDSKMAIYDSGEGLYYNVDLLEELELESPAKLWNEGKWTWDTFKDYVAEAQEIMGEDRNVLGGMPSEYAWFMLAGNGDYIINPTTNLQNLNSTNAKKTLGFLRDNLYVSGYWEEDPNYDTGSLKWKQSKVLFHPGQLWFIDSNMRWEDLDFKVSYVPYPMGPDLTSVEEYKLPTFDKLMFSISKGDEDNSDGGITEEVLFLIWNDLQDWKSEDKILEEFEDLISLKYDDPESVDAHMSIIRNVYYEKYPSATGGAATAENSYIYHYHKCIVEGLDVGEAGLDQYAQVVQARLNEVWG